MTRAVISINAGSSSIKFALYRLGSDGEPVHAAGGKIEGIGLAPHLVARADDGSLAHEQRWPDGAALTHEDLLAELFDWAASHLGDHEVVAIGHRVVHGGTRFSEPVRVDDAVLGALDELSALAPLHQPHNLAAIRALSALAPGLPHVACFDTAFHAGRSGSATRFALPRALHDRGIRRYGFHGLSYEYIARHLAQIDPIARGGQAVVAHLGSGASLCAMAKGRSVDTTMGFTALDGLMMGTRCGALDPGVVLHLIQHEGMTAREVEHMLYRDAGLLGVSGVSSDMRDLWASEAPSAREAIDLFAARTAQGIAGLVASLGGLDTLVFTAGIGENDAAMRALIAGRLGFLGIVLDPAANGVHAAQISQPGSKVAVRVIPTDEERMIALHTIALIKGLRP